MIDEFLRHSQELRSRREPYAHAIVVRHGKPISGKPGDKAIIHQDGSLHGWIGGGCTHPIVVKEALQALREGKPRMIAVNPSGSTTPLDGVVQYEMTCHSGGALDVYIEPVLPEPQVLVLGSSPVGRHLKNLAREIGYFVPEEVPTSCCSGGPDLQRMNLAGPVFVVVATQGEDDELALEEALKTDAPYVAFVGSRKKASALQDYLRRQGIPEPRLAELRTPAGLDLSAQTPAEIALSVLAEIIQTFRNLPSRLQAVESPELDETSAEAVDPICGMSVRILGARHVAEFAGHSFFFCCAGCRVKFLEHPEEFVGESSENSDTL